MEYQRFRIFPIPLNGSNLLPQHLESITIFTLFLVVGDPFGATTHTDLVLRAREQGIPHRVVHNASIMNAIGCTGLQANKSINQKSEGCLFTWPLFGEGLSYS